MIALLRPDVARAVVAAQELQARGKRPESRAVRHVLEGRAGEDITLYIVQTIGPKPAARFFRQATSATVAPTGKAPADVRTPVNALHRHWKEYGGMPLASAFLADGDADCNRDLFAADGRMIAALQPADAISPEDITPA